LAVRSSDGLFFLWLKLLVNLWTGAGLGELDVDGIATLSEATEEGFLAATACALGGGTELSSSRESSVGIALVEIRGEVPRGDTPRGEAASAGVLKG